jgi:hypothetical protein
MLEGCDSSKVTLMGRGLMRPDLEIPQILVGLDRLMEAAP